MNRERTESEKRATAYTSEPICPYCGHHDEEWWDGESRLRGDGDQAWQACSQCNGDYETTIHIAPEFTTRTIEESK